MKTKSIISLVEEISSIGERRFEKLARAEKWLVEHLVKESVPYKLERYNVEQPKWGEAFLKADDINVDCLPTGFTAGEIRSNYALASSLVSSRLFLDVPHVNFNPKSEVISRANFSFAPSLAIAKKDVIHVMNAKDIFGGIQVEKVLTQVPQVLVGNMKNPENIVFCHMDSNGPGAIDNASGVAVSLAYVIRNKRELEETLFVFDGNEELSYDYPVYWGRGYRDFEKKYGGLLKRALRIIAIDCVGYASAEVITDIKILNLALPLKNNDVYGDKLCLIASDYDMLMRVYHSESDTVNLLEEKFLIQALEKLNERLSCATVEK